jgi:hypothetical protein
MWKIKLSLFMVACFLCVGIVQAQESVNSTGSIATGSNGTVTYTIGQLFYTTNSSISGHLAQGVQHPYEILKIDSISTSYRKEAQEHFSILLFPNPTADNIILDVQDYINEKLIYFLFDYNGKLIFHKQITGKQTHIDLGNLPSSIYFVNVVDDENKKVQSFKIIKN